MRQVTVDGKVYKSIAEAWRNESPEGLPIITVHKRLKRGWAFDEAFKEPAVEPCVRPHFKKIRRSRYNFSKSH